MFLFYFVKQMLDKSLLVKQFKVKSICMQHLFEH